MKAALSSYAAIAVADDRPVLATAPLHAGFDRSSLSRYSDAYWDLGPAVFRENARRSDTRVDVDAVGDPAIAAAIRDYLYVRLNTDLPGYKMRASPVSVRRLFRFALTFFNFVKAECRVCDLHHVDQALLDRFAKFLRAGRRPVIVSQWLGIVFDLYAFRNHLSVAKLSFEPWRGRKPADIAGYRFSVEENRTPRIPEDIIRPLLAWSLKYVTVFAHDILAARNELRTLEDGHRLFVAEDALAPRNARRARRQARLNAYLDERRRQGRGIPVWPVRIGGPASSVEPEPPWNWHLIYLHIGADANLQRPAVGQPNNNMRRTVQAAGRELGTEVGGMDTQISVDPDTGGPWRSRFDVKALAAEERMLQAACYIVCAYLTGMRDSEVQAMRPGCLSVTRSEDGLIDRHRVKSVAYKGKQTRGEEAEWTTIAPVAVAISVLEQLIIRSVERRGTQTLWPVLYVARARKQALATDIVSRLNQFRDHLNERFGTAGEPVIPTGPNGYPWQLTTRQFRRTIAWHIANRPFGTIAGMIQYKHVSVATFEGYAGSSRSGFTAEVETERRLGQMDDILSYFDERQLGAGLAGPAATRIGRSLDSIAAELQPFPGMIADRARLRVLLADTARTLHIGVLADCFFDPATAVCLRHVSSGDKTAPMISLCEPTRCPNACITARHRPAWAGAAENAKAILKEKKLTELQRLAVGGDLRRIEKILSYSKVVSG
ncbi:integrase [Aminobacter sp. MET-1]|uniref:integrase n=1 Tax=Aminobacter sp. MET-1 TaxID=2951085 RepID=UPI002269AF2B|nr:integrase [Aminobacter sp. MET-1]MCX8571162.1 integrase [Aminobacter sp. MET-1]MCX8573340.1 integrase [Aminobacter sp. MET-1]